MSFWNNLSKLIDLTMSYGSGQVLVMLRNEYDMKIEQLERNVLNEEKNSTLRNEWLEKELEETKSKLWDTESKLDIDKRRVVYLESELNSKKEYISTFEADFLRLKNVEELAKTLQPQLVKSLAENKTLNATVDSLKKENQQFQISINRLVAIERELFALKEQFQLKEKEIQEKANSIQELNAFVSNLTTQLEEERTFHTKEIERIYKEEKEKILKLVSDAVVDTVVPIVQSNNNPQSERIIFDELNEQQQKMAIKEERMEANKILSEIKVVQAQQEAKQYQFESKIEKGLLQIREEKMLVDFVRIHNELKEYELTMRDFIQNKQIEFMKHEITMQSYLVEMSRNIVIADGKLLESEKNKMLVLEQVAQMGIEIKKQEVYLEKSLLIAERLKLDSERQNFANSQQEEQIKLAIDRFDVAYSGKMLDMSRKELDLEKMNFSNIQFHENLKNVIANFQNEFERNKIDLEKQVQLIEKGSFANQVNAALLELQKESSEIQNQLKSLAFEKQDLDMYFREREVKMGEEYNKVYQTTLLNERLLDKIHIKEKEVALQERMEDFKFRFNAAMENARFQYQSQMSNMQSQMQSQQHRIEQESLKNSQLQLQNSRLKDNINQYYNRKK